MALRATTAHENSRLRLFSHQPGVAGERLASEDARGRRPFGLDAPDVRRAEVQRPVEPARPHEISVPRYFVVTGRANNVMASQPILC